MPCTLEAIIKDLIFNAEVLKKSLISVCSMDKETKTLCTRLLAVTDRFLKELKYMQSFNRQILTQLVQMMREEYYKPIYTSLVFKLQRIKGFLDLIFMVYDILSFRERTYIRYNLTGNIKLITKFTHYVKREIGILKDYIVYVTPYVHYASLIIREEKICITMIPLADLFKPGKWILLVHELGHLFFMQHRKTLISQLLPVIETLMSELLPESRDKDVYVKLYKRLWREYWLEEIVSDIIGSGIGGPGYLNMLISEIFDHNPSSIDIEREHTHPPLDARVKAQISYFKQVGAPKELISKMRNIWLEFRGNICEELMLPPYFNDKILNVISEAIAKIYPNPPVLRYWNKLKNIDLTTLTSRRKEDVTLMILALAMRKETVFQSYI